MTSLHKITSEELKILLIVVFIAIGGSLGIDIHLASLPHIMKYMHTDKAHMQQSVSIFLLGVAVGMLFYGSISDKYGRKPTLTFGLLLACIASYAAVFTHTIDSFLFTRLIQGLGTGACYGMARTIVADTMQGEKLAYIGSYFSMIISLSPLLAPALGGYIQHWFDWQANFVFLGSYLLLIGIVFLVLCPETNLHKNPHAFTLKGLYKNYFSLISHVTFLISTLMGGLAVATVMSYSTISSFIFQIEYHLSPIIYGWITATVGLGSIVGKFFAPLSIRRFGTHKTLLYGFSIILFSGIWISVFLLLKIVNVPLIMIAVFTTMFGLTFIMPITMSFALSPHHDKRGAASALYGSFQMLVAFITSAVIGALPHGGVFILAISYCTLSIIGLLLFTRLPKPYA